MTERSASEELRALGEMDRRRAIGLAAASAVAGTSGLASCAPNETPRIRGYGKDPDLLKPGKYWPLTLKAKEREALALLADLLLPADDKMPAPSALGFADFIDEWMSAPYPEQQADAVQFRQLLRTLERKTGIPGWVASTPSNRARALAELAGSTPADPALSGFRKLVVAAAYTTPAGMEAIGYRGNMAIESFEGPPAEVLARFAAELKVLLAL